MIKNNMKYTYLLNQFKEKTIDPIFDEKMIEYKDSQNFIFTILALLYMATYDLIQIILNKLTVAPDFLLWLFLAEITFDVLLLSYVVFFARHNFILQRTLKIISFIIFYGTQLFLTVYLTIVYGDKFRVIRNLFLLFILSDFFVIIFLNFKVWVIIFVTTINFGVCLFCQLYMMYINKDPFLYLKEFAMLLEIAVACYVTRSQYDKLIDKVYSQMAMNNQGMNYIDKLLDQQPSPFITVSQGKIVYENKTMSDFLQENHKMEEQPKPVEIINSQQNMIENEGITLNTVTDTKKVTGEFLNLAQINYLHPLIEELLKMEKDKISIKNLFDIVEIFDKCDKDMLKEFISDEKFHYIGIVNYFSGIKNENLFFNIYLRKVKSYSGSWIEIMLSDITTSKKVQNLQEVYRLKENLLSKIAHEFKTPLICITTVAEQINSNESLLNAGEEFRVTKDLKGQLNQISDLSNYTLFLISDIIAYLKTKNTLEEMKSNGTKVKQIDEALLLIPCDVKEIVSSCFKILKTLLVYHSDKIKFITPLLKNDCGHITILSDPLRVKQIILNLLSNAVKFTQAGKISLNCEIKNSFLIISVEDTGIGIKDEDKYKIFGDGNMLETHMYLNKMGSGLGLSISKHFALMLGGNLEFSSHYEFGSKFFLSLPISENETATVVKIQKAHAHKKKSAFFVRPKNFSQEKINYNESE